MSKTILTYEELYHELFCLDIEHRMQRKDNTCFGIRLDEEYDITVYDNRCGEVYLEYNVNGKQITHYHPDYQEAYEDLADVLQNAEKEMESLKNDMTTSRRFTEIVVILVVLFLLVVGLFFIFRGVEWLFFR